MIKGKIKIWGAALCLLLAGSFRGYPEGENIAGGLFLVNTESFSTEGVENLSIDYGSGDVILRESTTGDLIIKEYMNKNRPQYYANISRSGDSLNIRQGRRPWFSWGRKVRAEIYLPPSFRKNLRISNSSGNFSGDTDLLGYRSIDILVSSGSTFLNHLSAETVSVRVLSGELDVRSIGGNSFVSLSSGKLQINDLSGAEHRIKVSSGRARINLIRGTGTIETSSGGIAVTRFEGDSSLVIKSGNIQIAELAGTTHQIRASSGRIEISKIRGQVEGHVSSGVVDLGDFSGQGSFDISSGDINLDMRELMGDLRFTLSSGKVNLTIPRETPFNLDVFTRSGSVSVDEDRADGLRISGNSTVLRPFGASPALTIYARTSSGSIRIKRNS